MFQTTKTTRYLLRFDDLCPAMNWDVWSEIEASLIEHRISPILAVVPDNQDPKLKVQPPVEDFWDRVRTWQSRGWAIALHGFQHKYTAENPGIVTTRKQTEFAGIPAAEQEEKLRRGTEILRREKIKPRVWIAPSNSFDATTVSLLRRFGIRIISDGCFRFPFVDTQGITWVPQQLFGFRPAPAGVWTVCYHHNQWSKSDLGRFRRDLDWHHADIGSLEEVLRRWAGRRSHLSAWLCRSPRLSQLYIRTVLKLCEWRTPIEQRNGPVGMSITMARHSQI